MIREDQLNREGKYEFPYECPICGHELSPEENIDVEIKDNVYRTMLRCDHCNFQKILAEESVEEAEAFLVEEIE